jgi:hypothetical protein
MMLDPRLERAEAEIRAVLETAAREGTEQLPPRDLIRRAMERGIGEEAVRVALWDLVDQRAIEFTPDRQVRLAGQRSAERATTAF